MAGQHSLLVGVGRVDITPPLGTPLAGYADPNLQRKAESVRDPLNATALVFEQQGTLAAIISLDVIIVLDETVQAIRQLIHEQTGILPANVQVCAIQTHSGPRTFSGWGWGEVDEPYVNGQMIPGAAQAVRLAFENRVQARMGIATCHSDVAINRRPINANHTADLGQLPWGLVDRQMTVLRFESASGTLANLVHYGAHPTVFGGQSRVISRDWPGIMIDRMEAVTGAPTLFINGAVGDVAPQTSTGRATGDGEATLWEAGGRAATDAVRAWRTIKDLREIKLGVHADTFELPWRPLPSLEEAQQAVLVATPDKDQPGRGMCEYKHWSAVVAAHEKPIESGKPYFQSLVALGPVVFVPFPGEPFTEIVLRVREASPFQYTLCASTSCGANGYYWSQEQLCRGGYEPWVAKAFGARLPVENIDDVLVDENLILLKRLHGAVYPPIGG